MQLCKNQDGFDALFHCATIGIMVVNREGVIEMVNPCADEMFGYEEGYLQGKMLEVLIPPDLGRKHLDFRNGYFSNPRSRPMGAGLRLQALKKDGTMFPVEISLGHYESEGKKLAVAFVTDITEQAKAHDIIVGREAWFRSMADNSPVMIWVSDVNKLCTYFNNTWLTFTGRTLEQELGNGWAEGVHPDDFEECFRIYSNSFDEHIPFEMEYRLQTTNNKYRWLLNRGRPLYSGDGIFEGYIGSCVDINSQKTLHHRMKKKVEEKTMELRQALGREKELSELKSRFVSIATHEFRTPLSALLSSASLIGQYLKSHDVEKCEKHVGRIKSSVKNLIEILNDFLSLEKLEQGKVEVIRQTFELSQIAEDIIVEMNSVLKQGQKIIYIHEGDSQICLDTSILRHVLFNLISNASKYSTDGEIMMRTRVENHTIQLEVADRGIGIPEDQQENIFQRFYRAGNTSDIQGTGLGLNIVKSYVELLGGTIHFSSKPNEGTTFFVEFPRGNQ
ncbi:MAG: PAS domain-containing sensor histidine kinase [Marivirga sp.]|nr:PAS domain-containing sensor histidine kinase [Marivirga sp.]